MAQVVGINWLNKDGVPGYYMIGDDLEWLFLGDDASAVIALGNSMAGGTGSLFQFLNGLPSVGEEEGQVAIESIMDTFFGEEIDTFLFDGAAIFGVAEEETTLIESLAEVGEALLELIA